MTNDSSGKTAPGVFRTVAFLIGYSALLAAAKFWLGDRVGSAAVVSDGWNNFADLFYSILLGLGFYVAQQPADDSHPHGHRRFESIVGLAVGLVILATGIHILAECRRRLLAPVPPSPSLAAIAVLTVFMLSKIWVGAFCRRAAARLRRPVLDAVGRDQQMDVFATLSAMAGYGGGAWSAPAFDPVFGGVISLWVFKVGGETVLEHVHQLTGRSAPPDILAAVARAVDESPLLFGMNDLRTHHVGPEYQVSLNVYADKTLTLEAVHAAEEDLKSRLLDIPGVAAAFIHIEPHDTPVKDR
ncbi:cation transporter [bacterium]|nr:cation transporter [bacterium]